MEKKSKHKVTNVVRNRATKPKPNARPKASARQPTCGALFVGPSTLAARLSRVSLSAETEALEGVAEYKRRDEAECVIPERSILTELTSTSAANKRRCYALGWEVPDSRNNRGAVLAVNGFIATIVNEGLFDVNVVVQQPHGHEAAPGSLAAWVLLHNRTLKAGNKETIHIVPISNNFVVPYRMRMEGKDCIVPIMFSAARQALSNAGKDVPNEEVGIRMHAAALYTASGSNVEGGKYFTIRTFQDDTFMQVVNPLPPMPVTVRDVTGDAMLLRFDKAFSMNGFDLFNLKIETVERKNPNAEDWTGLDKDTIYTLPTALFGRTNTGSWAMGHHVKWCPIKKNWFVTSEPRKRAIDWRNQTIEQYLVGRKSKDDNFTPSAEFAGVFSANALLHPVLDVGLRVVSTKVAPLRSPLRSFVVRRTHPMLEGATWVETAMESVTFVVKVIKVAAAVAGAVGLLTVLDDQGDADLDKTSEFSMCEEN